MLCMAHSLSALRLTLDNKLIAIAIVISLLPSYDTLKTILTAAKSMEMMVENVHTQIALEEHRHTCGADSSSAFATWLKGTPKGNNRGHKSKGYCTHCKRPGHKIEECCMLKAEHEKNPAMAHVASDSTVLCAQMQNDEDDPICLFKLANTLTKRNNLADRWLIDSGAS